MDCTAAGRGARGEGAPGSRDSTAAAQCGIRPSGPGEIKLNGIRIATLASLLSVSQGRTVVDGTGLTGPYDIQLSFAPDSPVAGRGPDAPAASDARPSLFTALQEQLGLKLQPGNQTEDVLVIDRVSHPDED